MEETYEQAVAKVNQLLQANGGQLLHSDLETQLAFNGDEFAIAFLPKMYFAGDLALSVVTSPNAFPEILWKVN